MTSNEVTDAKRKIRSELTELALSEISIGESIRRAVNQGFNLGRDMARAENEDREKDAFERGREYEAVVLGEPTLPNSLKALRQFVDKRVVMGGKR